MGLKLYTQYKGTNRNAKRGNLEISDRDVQAIIATATGTQINEATRYNTRYSVTNTDDANDIVILPDAPYGANAPTLELFAAEGFELRTHDPANVAINGGAGANFESAIAAGDLVYITRTSATTWQGFAVGSDGTTAGVEAANNT